MAVASLIVRIAADIAQFEKNIAQVERTLQKTGRNLEQVGTQLTKGITLPLVAMGGLAAKAAIDFESSFAGVRKTVDATEGQFKELEGQFRDMAKTMPMTVNEINRVAEAAGQLGVRREDLVGFTEAMIKIGTATNLTAEEAAVGMQRFANAIGEPRINMEKLGSALVELGNKGASTERDILEMANRIAGTGAQIGLTAGEIFGMANALSSVGIEAEKGGSAISRLFKDMNKAVSEGGDALREFAKVAELPAEAFAKLFKDDAASAITKFVEGLGRIKAAGGDLLPILDQLGIKEVRYSDTVLLAANSANQFAESIRNGNKAFGEGKALDREYQERLKTTASQLIILKSNLMDVAITFGQAMLPAINKVVQGSKPVIEVFAGIADGFKALPGPIRDVTLAFLAVLAAAGPVVFIASQVVKAWASLLAIVRFVPVALNAVGTAFVFLAGTMGATTTGLRGVTGAMALLRLGAIALAAPLYAIPLLILTIAASIPKAIQGFNNFNAAVQTGRLWQLITTKDAPAIWEKEFFGWSRGANAAAGSFKELNKAAAGANIDAMFDRVAGLKRELSGDALASQVRELQSAFSNLDPAVQRSADSLKRTGEKALALRDEGAKLTPELEKLANKAVADLNRELKAGQKEIDQYAEEIKNLRDQLSGAALQADVKKLAEAFQGMDAAAKENPDTLRRVGEAADKLRDQGATLPPVLLSVADAFRAATKEASNFGEQGFDQFENVDNWTERFKKFNDELDRTSSISGGQGERGFDQFENTRSFEDQLAKFKPGFVQRIFGDDLGQQLGGIFVDAVSTGDFRSAIGNAASAIGSSLMKDLATSLTTGANAITGFFGGFLKTVLPGLGALLGPLVDKIFDVFGNKGRDAVKDFAASFGGFDSLHDRLLELGSAGEALWRKLTQGVGRNNPEQAAAVIAEVQAALDAFGTEAERAERRLTALGVAVEGVNAKAALFAAPFQALKDAMKGLDEGSEFDALQAKMAETAQRGQAEFERLGIFVGATFAGLVKETGDVFGALTKLGPAFTVLQQGVNEFGLTSTGTINQLLSMFRLVNDAVTGPILQSIQATGQIFAGLQDAGYLTSDLFQTVASDIGASFRDLEAKGGDVAQAMALSQPVLQRLWEGQQIYGDITDETTRKILDQAEEQGLVGARMQDVNRQILDVLIAIADVFGAKLPEAFRQTSTAARDTARDIEREFSGIRLPTLKIPIEYDDPGFTGGRVPALAHGGIVRRPTLALIGEAGPEAVVPLSQLSSVSAGDGGGVTVIFEQDGRRSAEFIVPYIPGVVKRYGLV